MATIKEIIREWHITQKDEINITDDLLENVNLEDILVATEIMLNCIESPFYIESKFCSNGSIIIPLNPCENINNIVTFINVILMRHVITYKYHVLHSKNLETSDYYSYYNEKYTNEVLEYCKENDVPFRVMRKIFNIVRPVYEIHHQILLDRYCMAPLKSARNI